MKALIFAAGKGTRMQPLTTYTPKPLLTAGGRRLIDWQLQRLAAAGVDEVIINTSWLAEQFPAMLGEQRNGLRLRQLLAGEPGPYRDTVLLNAAAALVVAGTAPDLVAGVTRAAEAIESVIAELSADDLVELNRQSVVDQASSADIATGWLTEKGLL